MVAKTQF